MNFLYCKFIEFVQNYNLPDYIGTIIFSVLPFALILAFLMLVVILLVLFERKLLAYFTQRKGPNRVGIWGILQTTADGIKLLCKENIELLSSDKILFSLCPVLVFTSIIMLWCIVPFNGEFNIVNSDYGLLLFFIFASFPMLFHFLAGYSSNNKYSLIGSYRALSLTASYSVAIFFVLLSIICITETINLDKIIQYQIHLWNIVSNPIGFIIFYISMIAKLNRCPFDLSEAESEIICGYHTEYSGMRFAMFFLGEYAEFFIISLLFVILFLGGYLPPLNQYLSNIFLENCYISKYLIYFEQTFWLLVKTILIIFSIIWIRASLPRLTQMSVLKLFWKYLIPISLINLILILILK